MERNRATQSGVTIRSESIGMLIYSPDNLTKGPFNGYRMKEFSFCLGENSSWSTRTPMSRRCSGKLGASHHWRQIRNLIVSMSKREKGKAAEFSCRLTGAPGQEPSAGAMLLSLRSELLVGSSGSKLQQLKTTSCRAQTGCRTTLLGNIKTYLRSWVF